MSTDLILCFHIDDLYRGKVEILWWIELVITIFTSIPILRFLDEWIQPFDDPILVQSTLDALDVWSALS